MPEVYVAQDGKVVPPVVSTPVSQSGAKHHKTVVDEVLGRVGEKGGRECMGAYCVRPGKKFVNQQGDEEIVLLLRAHPITNLTWILMVLGMLVLPEVLSMTGIFAPVPFEYVWVGKMVWYLVTMGITLERFLKWYYSVLVITNERIVDIDFHNLLYRHVSYANLNHIEQPTAITGGFFRHMFDFGDLHVETAAEHQVVEGLAVPFPDRAIRIISELSEELEKRRERGE
ncbi:MAG: hypothetical protein AAB909_03815 [Patescibacteria group bacterium]